MNLRRPPKSQRGKSPYPPAIKGNSSTNDKRGAHAGGGQQETKGMVYAEGHGKGSIDSFSGRDKK